MKVLFVYPESYLNIGIPGGIAIMSAMLKKEGHQVDLFDTTFIKTKNSYLEEIDRTHGGSGLSDKGGVSVFKKTEYTIEDLVKDDPILEYENVFQKKIDSFKPDIIALSCMTSTFDFACDLFRTVKHNSVVIVGGVHSTMNADLNAIVGVVLIVGLMFLTVNIIIDILIAIINPKVRLS